MGWFFRKRIRLLPGVHLNVGKRGASVSLGRRGASVNLSRRGTRTTVSLPGTGLGYSHHRPHAPQRADAATGAPARPSKKWLGVLLLLGLLWLVGQVVFA